MFQNSLIESQNDLFVYVVRYKNASQTNSTSTKVAGIFWNEEKATTFTLKRNGKKRKGIDVSNGYFIDKIKVCDLDNTLLSQPIISFEKSNEK